MRNTIASLSVATLIVLPVSLLLTGCKTGSDVPPAAPAPKAEAPARSATPPQPAAAASTASTTAATPKSQFPIRIKTGVFSPVKDSEGNVWLPDQGFADGETLERPDLLIANTKIPEVYRAERYSMTAFSYPVPNGKYTVKLHFAETYEGITGPGERVFSFNVQGQEFKDFDVWAKTGGAQRAYVQTVNVEVADGKLNIKFTPNVENPEINGIEIMPR
jgi:hypothetical protein